MEILLFIVIPAAIVLIIFILWWIGVSNGFKRKTIKVTEALSGIEVALTKRSETLTKLLDITKGYAAHEKETLAQVIQMRKGMTVGELNQASTQCDQLFTRINALAEGYPELRSAEHFKELQSATREIEKHIQAARRLYNSNVTAFNTAIVVFPSSIVAKSQNLAPRDFFVAEEGKLADVEMKF